MKRDREVHAAVQQQSFGEFGTIFFPRSPWPRLKLRGGALCLSTLSAFPSGRLLVLFSLCTFDTPNFKLLRSNIAVNASGWIPRTSLIPTTTWQD